LIERIEDLLGFNNYPGGPFGSWGPEGGSGLYGQIQQATGPLPLPSDSSGEDPSGDGSGNYTSPRSAAADLLTARADAATGPGRLARRQLGSVFEVQRCRALVSGNGRGHPPS
jgi:hypothetical protein